MKTGLLIAALVTTTAVHAQIPEASMDSPFYLVLLGRMDPAKFPKAPRHVLRVEYSLNLNECMRKGQEYSREAKDAGYVELGIQCPPVDHSIQRARIEEGAKKMGKR